MISEPVLKGHLYIDEMSPQDMWLFRIRVNCFWLYLLKSTYYIYVPFANISVLNGHSWCYYSVSHRHVTFDKKVFFLVISVLKNSNYCCIPITYVCTCINGTPIHTCCTYNVHGTMYVDVLSLKDRLPLKKG
jgi:hypothetical protein